MNASKRISLLGTGLLVLSAGTLMAQEAGTRAPGRDQGREGNAQQNAAQGTTTTTTETHARTSGHNAQGARAGNDTRMLIEHAVSMAIGGTTLKGQAEQAGKMDTPGQAGAPGDQGQAGAPGQAGSQRGHAQAGAGGDPSQQLMMHARKEIQESQRLLQAAGRDQASAQQLYTAADGYINTLLTLCGESTTTQDAGSARAGNAAGEAGRAGTGRSSRDEDLGAGQAGRQGKTLGARDKAAVALINHSVCEVIEGTHMTQMLQSQAAGNSAAMELLLRHAREMTSEGRETLQRFVGSSRTGSGGAGISDGGDAGRNAARAENAGARAENDQAKAGGDAAQAAGGQAGDASVMTLARRGQELVEAFQAGGQGGAQGGTGRPGSSRLDREGDASGADRSSGTSRSSDAESKTSPR